MFRQLYIAIQTLRVVPRVAEACVKPPAPQARPVPCLTSFRPPLSPAPESTVGVPGSRRANAGSDDFSLLPLAVDPGVPGPWAPAAVHPGSWHGTARRWPASLPPSPSPRGSRSPSYEEPGPGILLGGEWLL